MLCASLGYNNEDQCMNILNDLTSDEMAEIRVDLISELGNGNVDWHGMKRILTHARTKIATCRDLKTSGFTEERRNLLCKCLANGDVQFVDIEIEAPKEYREHIVKCAKENNVKVIISYHNYECTPSLEELEKLVDTCFTFGGQIAKIAVKANSVHDTARILSLYDVCRRDNPDEKLVALAMGEPGMISRVASIYLDGHFTFVAADELSATAPGQLTLKQMRALNSILKSK